MICKDDELRGRVAAMLALAEQHHCNGLKKACVDVLNNAPAKRRPVMPSDDDESANKDHY